MPIYGTRATEHVRPCWQTTRTENLGNSYWSLPQTPHFLLVRSSCRSRVADKTCFLVPFPTVSLVEKSTIVMASYAQVLSALWQPEMSNFSCMHCLKNALLETSRPSLSRIKFGVHNFVTRRLKQVSPWEAGFDQTVLTLLQNRDMDCEHWRASASVQVLTCARAIYAFPVNNCGGEPI